MDVAKERGKSCERPSPLLVIKKVLNTSAVDFDFSIFPLREDVASAKDNLCIELIFCGEEKITFAVDFFNSLHQRLPSELKSRISCGNPKTNGIVDEKSVIIVIKPGYKDKKDNIWTFLELLSKNINGPGFNVSLWQGIKYDKTNGFSRPVIKKGCEKINFSDIFEKIDFFIEKDKKERGMSSTGASSSRAEETPKGKENSSTNLPPNKLYDAIASAADKDKVKKKLTFC